MHSACVPRCATSANAWPQKATRWWRPIPFSRMVKAPVFEDASKVSFQNPADREKINKFMGPIGAPGVIERDAVAFVAFLDSQPQVDKTKKIGNQGYCMGGA